MAVGTLVVNETVYPIARITLEGSRILFWSEPIRAPVHLPGASEIHVHAPDGTLVFTAQWTLAEKERAKLAPWADLFTRNGWVKQVTICFPLAITDVVGWPVG